MLLQALAFYVFAFVVMASAAMVVVSRNPVYSVLFLVLAFFNAAALFLLIGAEFIAMILIIVYVGAVAVLFLFVVMMLDINLTKLREGFLKYLPVGAMIGFVLFLEILFGLGVLGGNTDDLGRRSARPVPQVLAIDNTRAIGRVLYTQYFYLFQVAGLVLLVAMIGAIVLTLRRRPGVRRQRISEQLYRPKDEAVTVVKVPTRGGRVMAIGLDHYLFVAAVLFTLGILGIFLNRKNVIVILMCVELMLLAVNINLVAFSVFQGNIVGQIFAMLVLTVAAAEAAIGLAILVVYFRNRGTIEVEDINAMKG